MAGESASITERVSGQFTTLAWVLIPVAVGINVVGGALTNVLRIPLFLDSIGTLLLAILAGPFVAAVGGVLTNVVLSVVRSPTMLPFGATQAAIALVAGFLAMRGWFLIRERRDYLKLAGVAVAVAATSVLVGWPLLVWIFGGITGTAPDIIVGIFLAAGFDINVAALGSQLVIEPVDKAACVVIAYVVATSVPERYRPSFGQRTLSND